ncbi:adenosine deaminase [Lentiprolixibacter aurantiacus]|uniref:adenosine deaminase n=1 Tax=Lentiprolixibacter aurantiacus TaxID=2993939 RepID=A0AAE3SMW5_9FLAO|nr:adenosine deaminase [Lentiprolixibacter aurantiacus]MCX2719112.1 adenosine deaminase [Lentiprolixibacter aurantiacus]
MGYQTLPKIELHLHLDCSLSYEVASTIKPGMTREDYEENFIAPPKCTDLADYLTRAIKGFELMQTREQLRMVTLDLFKQLKADGVIYAEIRFAPLLHTGLGLSPEEVVETVIRASQEGIERFGVEARLILCTLRRFNEEQSLQTARIVNEFKGTLVVGMDIAGDEAGYPIDAHRKAFAFANKNGIKCTAHAGEACGPHSVWETIKHFHPLRIGHGARSIEDEDLLQFLKKHKLHLEICPTSNIQVNVFDQIENHPVDLLYRKGLSISINTDARTISDTTLVNEYSKLEANFGWTSAHFKYCNMEAIEHAFAPQELKDKIRLKLLEAYR